MSVSVLGAGSTQELESKLPVDSISLLLGDQFGRNFCGER